MSRSWLHSRIVWDRAFLGYPYWAVVIGFWAVPIAFTIWLSLREVRFADPSEFVGLGQYAKLLADPLFWKAFANTLLFSLCSIAFCMGLAIGVAFVISRAGRRFGRVVSAAIMIPGLCSPFGLAILFLLLFHGEEGLLNRWLTAPFGLEAINWLKDPLYIFLALVIQSAWRWVGFMAFIVMAALESIPSDRLDAARIDGASEWRVFVSISLPSVSKTICYCGLFLFVDCVSQFSGAYVLLGASGGSGESGLMLVSLAYRLAFVEGDFGAASSVSILSVPLLALGAVALLALASNSSSER